jgi:hypothetical protein
MGSGAVGALIATGAGEAIGGVGEVGDPPIVLLLHIPSSRLQVYLYQK